MTPTCRCRGLSLAVALAAWTAPLLAVEPPLQTAPATPPLVTPYVIPFDDGVSAPAALSLPENRPTAREHLPVRTD